MTADSRLYVQYRKIRLFGLFSVLKFSRAGIAQYVSDYTADWIAGMFVFLLLLWA